MLTVFPRKTVFPNKTLVSYKETFVPLGETLFFPKRNSCSPKGNSYPSSYPFVHR